MQVGIQDGDSHICQFSGCTEMDLLSARCTNCGKNFCSQHLNGSAHHCTAAKDERVPTCPVCARAVSLEYPQQPMDEAVSRHIDRGCKDLPKSSSSATTASSSAAQAPMHPLLAKLFPGGGQRLGGPTTKPANRCAAVGCGRAEEVRIVCDLCGKTYCIEHRNPSDHNCPGRRVSPSPQPEPVLSSSESNPRASPGPAVLSSIAGMLAHPRNTPKTALGKATESAQDMSTPLVCFLVPSRKPGTDYAAVPSLFYNINKSWSMGRAVDAVVDAASQSSSAVSASTPWKAYVVAVPIPVSATSPMYPATPLSSVVRNSALGRSSQSVVFISALDSDLLPEEAIKAAAEAQRGVQRKESGGESCSAM